MSFYKILLSISKVVPLAFRLKLMYLIKFKRNLNLNKPTFYTEKIQKRKLNMMGIYSTLSDKHKVRYYISSKIGDEHLIKLLGVYNNINEIDFTLLPDKFVIKTNFGSGYEHIEIIKNKNEMSLTDIKLKFNIAMKSHYKGSILGENQYNDIDKKIIVEDYIESSNGGIDDFKFHIFNSKNGFLQIDFDRFINHKRNLYDLDFNKLNFNLCYSGGDYILPSLIKLNEMKEIAFHLAKDFDYVRVDLYLVNDQIFFGEMTFTPGSGFERFSSSKADLIYGQMWNQK